VNSDGDNIHLNWVFCRIFMRKINHVRGSVAKVGVVKKLCSIVPFSDKKYTKQNAALTEESLMKFELTLKFVL
jgi:hypothetical protein